MHKNQVLNFIYEQEEIRIDILITKLTNLSRANAQNLILQKKVLIDNNLVSKKNQIVKTGQKVEIFNDYQSPKPSLVPAEMKLEIVFQDENILLINKPKNLVVHPGVGNWNNTLVNGLISYFESSLFELNNVRPGIIHRLDKDTTGLILVAKNAKAHNFFTNQLANREIKRFYKAIVIGKVPHKIMKINLPIARDLKNPLKKTVSHFNSKPAITNVELIKHFNYQNKDFSLVKCQLETGRTHQIRVHLAHIGFPVYGDPVYGKKVDELGQRLHAYKVIFTNLNGKNQEFRVDLPKEFDIAFD
ncbi:ribosomal large subunit pseudouridine synthase D [Mesomycoplasma dispar]|uniref:Pseudouridine synthase n=1 Tax=Mesomycoplasma dispar TaxID=86660 RepID=A0AAJ5NS44_9BACT|nr:RluA family pseudouridine synthase [Mesomycoplasma dispar]AJR12175.1 pseudouridine synthase [Mesomycoplasma dispar]ATP59655.1 RluA family pseudouridine synthase [Mesomycoplasma dispar]VEU61724.1 ribosomal large subunit pseudouridine synthase D [Mesomycoplasma dispar]